MKIRRLNKPLLRKLALKLRGLRHEEHYDQAHWAVTTRCGTAACIAGFAAMEAGWRPFLTGDAVSSLFGTHYCVQSGSKRRRTIKMVAAEALGFSPKSRIFTSVPGVFWPGEYRERWQLARLGQTSERFSRIAADLLDAIADGKVKP